MRATFFLLGAALLVVVTVPSSCTHGVFNSTHFFSYPPSSAPDNNDWQYVGQVDIWGSPLEENWKRIDISVWDKGRKHLLRDTANVHGRNVNAFSTWTTLDQLGITFYEGMSVSYREPDSLRNRVILRDISYLRNAKTGKFQRR